MVLSMQTSWCRRVGAQGRKRGELECTIIRRHEHRASPNLDSPPPCAPSPARQRHTCVHSYRQEGERGGGGAGGGAFDQGQLCL
jgi:hypothetical protein